MRQTLLCGFFVAMTIVLPTALLSADALPPDEQAFVDKHMSDIVSVMPKRIDDGAVVKTISSPIYILNITIKSGDGGSMTQSQMAARVGDKLVPVSRPGTDGDCPDIASMFKADFKLKSDDDANAVQAAFNQLYPLITDDEKKAVAFHHNGHDWQFIRGTFFDKHMGFIITTDDSGKITAVKYSLKL